MSKHVEEPIVKCPECGHQFPLSKALKESIELQVVRRIQLQYVEREEELEERVMKRAAEQHRLTDAAKDKQLADVRKQLEEAQRKAQQSSQQLQGEVAELDLEEQLRRAFPLDQLQPIATGQRGADLCRELWTSPAKTAARLFGKGKTPRTFLIPGFQNCELINVKAVLMWPCS